MTSFPKEIGCSHFYFCFIVLLFVLCSAVFSFLYCNDCSAHMQKAAGSLLHCSSFWVRCFELELFIPFLLVLVFFTVTLLSPALSNKVVLKEFLCFLHLVFYKMLLPPGHAFFVYSGEQLVTLMPVALWPHQLTYHLNCGEPHTWDAEEGSNVGGWEEGQDGMRLWRGEDLNSV